MYFDDYEVGMVFDQIEPISFSEEELIEAGKKFDPRLIHIDKKAAEESRFGQIIGPGSYTNMVFWGQWIKTGIDADGVIAGIGVDYAQWLRPVVADVLYTIKAEVVDKKIRKPGKDGSVAVLVTAYDPEGNEVSKYCGRALVAYRKDNFKKNPGK